MKSLTYLVKAKQNAISVRQMLLDANTEANAVEHLLVLELLDLSSELERKITRLHDSIQSDREEK